MTDQLDRIEHRAREVRGQLALDFDELLVRLNPRRLARDLAASAREAPTSGFGTAAVREMRRNPIPYLLIGVGIAGVAWAIASASQSRSERRLPKFQEADFAPPPAATTRAGPAMPVRPASPATQPAREISPVSPVAE
jgi:hypothetical protein